MLGTIAFHANHHTTISKSCERRVAILAPLVAEYRHSPCAILLVILSVEPATAGMNAPNYRIDVLGWNRRVINYPFH